MQLQAHANDIGCHSAVYTSTPADVPDPPFRFFEGLAPRLSQGGHAVMNVMCVMAFPLPFFWPIL